jgi:guanidinobutyrase
MATRISPFDGRAVADIGDIPINPYSLDKSIRIIEDCFDPIFASGCKPLGLGGDHTIVLPILRSAFKTHGPVGVIHVDAHSDINDTMFGEKIAHGTPFRRAYEEGLIEPSKVFQIGLRGTGYSAEDFDWSRKKGFTVVQSEECWHKSLAPLMDDIRSRMGKSPVYLSFDIDALDPSVAPGTGTLEIGGLTIIQAMEIIRGCAGMNVIGGDMVEVSPPYDNNGTTATIAANLAFEMLCSFGRD